MKFKKFILNNLFKLAKEGILVSKFCSFIKKNEFISYDALRFIIHYNKSGNLNFTSDEITNLYIKNYKNFENKQKTLHDTLLHAIVHSNYSQELNFTSKQIIKILNEDKKLLKIDTGIGYNLLCFLCDYAVSSNINFTKDDIFQIIELDLDQISTSNFINSIFRFNGTGLENLFHEGNFFNSDDIISIIKKNPNQLNHISHSLDESVFLYCLKHKKLLDMNFNQLNYIFENSKDPIRNNTYNNNRELIDDFLSQRNAIIEKEKLTELFNNNINSNKKNKI